MQREFRDNGDRLVGSGLNGIDYLRGLERMLIGIGFALALWSALTVAQAHFYSTLRPPPPRSTTARLPGEEPANTAATSTTRTRLGPRTGEWVARLEVPRVDLSATVLEGSDD